MSGLRALPHATSLERGDRVTLSARATETIGTARRYIDVTADAEWRSTAPEIAYVDKSGVLYAKNYGSATVNCLSRGFAAQAEVIVESHASGDHTIVFEGLPAIQQIGFDYEDNMFITNQTASIFCLKATGGLHRVIQLRTRGHSDYQFDCIAVAKDQSIYVSAPNPRRVLQFTKDGDAYRSATEIGLNDNAVQKSIALSSRGIVIGIMGATPGSGSVLCIDRSGKSTTFATRDSAHNLVVGADDRVYVAAPRARAVDVYDLDGALLDTLVTRSDASIGAIAIDTACRVYIAEFYSGDVVRLDAHGPATVLLQDLGNPCGMAFDSRGRLHVADASSGRIYRVY
jgi:hypothetical protein